MIYQDTQDTIGIPDPLKRLRIDFRGSFLGGEAQNGE